MWGAVFILAVAGTAFATPDAVYPEDLSLSGSRIVSGWEAEPGQFPHQLSLRMVSPAGSVFACGGSILNAEWGLTAAHCTANRVTIVIRVGTVNITQPAAIFETTKYYNHPLYNEAISGIVQPNDIGLLEFGRTLTFSDLVKPVRIQRSSAMNENYAGLRAEASGWGNTWTGGSSPENLNWVNLRLISNVECRASYGGSAIIADSTICTRGYDNPTQSTCQGDSGGPLSIIDIDGETTQVGVASFVSGLGCHADIPSGFIRPGPYHTWFTQVTGYDFDWEYDVTTSGPEVTDSGESHETSTPDSEESNETPSPDSEESNETSSPDSEESPESIESPESEESKPESSESKQSSEESKPESSESKQSSEESKSESSESKQSSEESKPESSESKQSSESSESSASSVSSESSDSTD